MKAISNRLTNRELRLSTADQITSSLSNLVFILLVANSSSPEGFAQISTIWTVISFSVVISRSVFGVPLLLDQHTRSVQKPILISGARLGALLLGVPAVIASFSIFLFGQGDSGLAFIVLAACTPLILLQDFGRYLAIANGKGQDALASDLLLLIPLAIAGINAIAKPQVLNALDSTLVLFASLLVSLVALRKYGVVTLSFKHLRTTISSDSLRRKKLFQESITSAFTAVATILAVWVAYDPLAVAAFNGALYVLSPITLTVLIVNLVIQQSVSKSNGVIHKREYAIFVTLLFASVVWSLSVANLPNFLGSVLLGDSWNLVQPLVIPMGAVLCLSLVMEFVFMVFRSREQFSLVVRVRILLALSTPFVYVICGALNYSLSRSLYVVSTLIMFVVLGLYVRSRSYFLG